MHVLASPETGKEFIETYFPHNTGLIELPCRNFGFVYSEEEGGGAGVSVNFYRAHIDEEAYFKAPTRYGPGLFEGQAISPGREATLLEMTGFVVAASLLMSNTPYTNEAIKFVRSAVAIQKAEIDDISKALSAVELFGV